MMDLRQVVAALRQLVDASRDEGWTMGNQDFPSTGPRACGLVTNKHEEPAHESEMVFVICGTHRVVLTAAKHYGVPQWDVEEGWVLPAKRP
jgi:hypothetical protein